MNASFLVCTTVLAVFIVAAVAAFYSPDKKNFKKIFTLSRAGEPTNPDWLNSGGRVTSRGKQWDISEQKFQSVICATLTLHCFASAISLKIFRHVKHSRSCVQL